MAHSQSPSPTLSLLRPIAFQPAFVDLCDGSITAGLMLSQILYWTPKAGKEADGWFYKTREDWYEELRLSRTQQENARAILREKGFVIEQIRQHGNGTKVYFKLAQDSLSFAVSQWQETCKSTCGKPADPEAGNLPGVGGKPATPIRKAETTTETTFILSPPSSEHDGSRSSKKKEPDPRHAPFRKSLEGFWAHLNPGRNHNWGPGDAGQLGTLLKEWPDLTKRDFDGWLLNYRDSENINEPDTPKEFLPRLHRYANGPLNGYGKPFKEVKEAVV